MNSNLTGFLFVVIIDCTQETKKHQGAFRNEINNRNIECATFRDRAIAHTDWVQYWIAVVYPKPGNLHLSQDLSHPDRLTPDIAPYLSVHCFGVMSIEYLLMVLLI